MLTMPSTAVTIIRANIEHVGLLTPLFDAYRQFYQQPSDLQGAQAFLTERLERGESVIFLGLLEKEGGSQQPVGFTQLYPLFTSTQMRRMWLLNDLFVAPQARQRGVGHALLEHARRFATETGAAEMMLQTAVTNTTAQALYQSLGWQRDTEYVTYTLQCSTPPREG
jgi:GNAT superfamily N-acetyltransferase